MSATGPELKAGDVVPGTRYVVVRALGAGGMGIVYQVVKSPNIGGVMKLMSTELVAHEEHCVRFFDEVRILAQLDHPNIVKVFDYDALEDGTPFYVMEILSGRTVRDVITTIGRVPARVAYEITRQLLEALQCAHTHEVPVIHRDIKPENIFLHAPRHGDPVVKLIDFGVSAVADRKHDGAFVGTWSYAAPEQIRGEAPTPTTDLYAVGLVLYEMLAGVGPFDHHLDWAKVSKAQLDETPAPVSKFAPWVPASIVKLIASALEKDPKKRPKDAYAFAERLYELEWASDGKDPHDLTKEGPSAGAVATQDRGPIAATPLAGSVGTAVAGPSAAAQPAAEGRGPRARGGGAGAASDGPGPLSRILSSVTAANPSSKNMAAAKPASDRLGDVPLIGVPPESVRSGPTWRGVGDTRELTAPGTNALLEGLGAEPRKPASKRERLSDPESSSEGTPRPGQVVIRAGRGAGEGEALHGPTTPRGLLARRPSAAVTAEGEQVARGVGAARDTFASQASDTRATSRSRTGVLALAGLVLLCGAAIAAVVIARGDPHRVDHGGVAGSAVGVNAIVASSMTGAPPDSATSSDGPVAPGGSANAARLADEAPSVAVGAGAAPASALKPAGRRAAGGTRASASSLPASKAPPPPTAKPSGAASGEFIRTL